MARWSKDRSCCVGTSLGQLGPDVTVLPQAQFSSVDAAISALQTGAVNCPGYCAVFSSRMGAYYLLWPAELPPPQAGAQAAPMAAPVAAPVFAQPEYGVQPQMPSFAGYSVAAPVQSQPQVPAFAGYPAAAPVQAQPQMPSFAGYPVAAPAQVQLPFQVAAPTYAQPALAVPQYAPPAFAVPQYAAVPQAVLPQPMLPQTESMIVMTAAPGPIETVTQPPAAPAPQPAPAPAPAAPAAPAVDPPVMPKKPKVKKTRKGCC